MTKEDGKMAGRLEGKVAIVSGSARGMGAAHARKFVEEGASVVVSDVLDAEGEPSPRSWATPPATSTWT